MPASPTRHRLTRWVRDLRLFWKILVPFAVLLVIVGSVSAFVVLHDVAVRTQTSLDQVAAQESAAARSSVHDRELYLLEAAELAANVQGMAGAVTAHDAATVSTLVRSVLALKPDLTLVAVADSTGQDLGQFTRSHAGDSVSSEPATAWAGSPIVEPVLSAPGGTTAAGFLGFGDHPIVALATSICSGITTCQPVGAVIVAVDASRMLADLQLSDAVGNPRTSVALFDNHDTLVLASGRAPPPVEHPATQRILRLRRHSDELVYLPVTLQGHRAGTLAFSIPTASAFAAVHSAATRLIIVFLLSMLGIVAVGAGLSHLLLGQVRHLLETNRLLAAGDLSARAEISGRDELGELAAGVNYMAESLQQSHEHLEARVDERTAQVQRLLRERTDFFTAVSHEFRTPLAVVLGQAEMLQDLRTPKTSIGQGQAGKTIETAAKELLRFVNDILDIARAESGRVELNMCDVRVGPLIKGMQPWMETLTDSNGLNLHVQVPVRLPRVRADEDRLREVLTNLIDNAVKYTPRGGQVEVAATTKNGTVSVAVTDTGLGIPADAADRLFEPFYRVKGVATQGGQSSSGLGLALAKHLIEAQGGTIGFESQPGRGSTFTITIPASSTPPDRIRANRLDITSVGH